MTKYFIKNINTKQYYNFVTAKWSDFLTIACVTTYDETLQTFLDRVKDAIAIKVNKTLSNTEYNGVVDYIVTI